VLAVVVVEAGPRKLENGLPKRQSPHAVDCPHTLGRRENSMKQYVVTPGFKEQSRVHFIHAPKKTTYIITKCIEINVII
jgi:hypothetical protein